MQHTLSDQEHRTGPAENLVADAHERCGLQRQRAAASENRASSSSRLGAPSFTYSLYLLYYLLSVLALRKQVHILTPKVQQIFFFKSDGSSSTPRSSTPQFLSIQFTCFTSTKHIY